MSKMILAQSGILRSQSETIEKKSKQISQLEENTKLLTNSLNNIQETLQSFVETANQISQIQNTIKLLEKNVSDISEHSHINMDKIFALQDNIVSISNKHSELKSKISCNDKDMDYIDRRLTIVEKNFIKMAPDYVLIGFVNFIPRFVPNDFLFSEDNLKCSGFVNKTTLIINHFKYLKNLKEVNLDNFKWVGGTITFIGNHSQNDILSISPSQDFHKFYDENSNIRNPRYIPNIQDINARTYYKKGLRTLRSELSKIDIKLILNEDFEEFIRE